MKNKLLRISITFLTIFLLVLNVCPISVFANQPDSYYPLSIQKPEVTDHSGYIEYLSTNLNYGYQTVDVLYWSFTPSVSGNTSSYVSDMLNISLSRDSRSISMSVTCDPGVTGFLSVALCPYNGDISYNDYFITTTATTISTPARSGYELASVHYYGNYTDAGNLNDYNNQEFFVTYSADSVVNFQLTNIFSVLNSILQYMQTTEPSEDWEYDYYSDLSSILLALNNLDSTASSFRQDYLREVDKLLDLTESVLSKLDSIIDGLNDVNQGLEDIFLFLETWIIDIDNWLQELYWIELDSNGKLYEIKDTLDAILAILNAGKDKPTLQTPNDSIDSAFGDVSGWFADIDGFGDQLEQNRQENQQNLAQAGNIIGGFFSICPPQIIIALALCAIMIVIAKVIGR